MDYNNARETALRIVKLSDQRLGKKTALETICLQMLLSFHKETLETGLDHGLTIERYIEINRVIFDSLELAMNEGKRMREKEGN